MHNINITMGIIVAIVLLILIALVGFMVCSCIFLRKLIDGISDQDIELDDFNDAHKNNIRVYITFLQRGYRNKGIIFSNLNEIFT